MRSPASTITIIIGRKQLALCGLILLSTSAFFGTIAWRSNAAPTTKCPVVTLPAVPAAVPEVIAEVAPERAHLGDEAALAIAMSRGTSQVLVNARPAAQVSVDGVHRGMTPVNLRLPRGQHRVELIGPGGQRVIKRVQLASGKNEAVIHRFP